MPADKKKAGSGKGSPDDKDTSAKPLKLHATAKAFVPSAVSCVLAIDSIYSS